MGFLRLMCSCQQRLLECVSPTHGRILLYVWAIEQDELSKRTIPNLQPDSGDSGSMDTRGQDVFVPWVLVAGKPRENPRPRKGARTNPRPPEGSDIPPTEQAEPKLFNRYYHMFAEGELLQLACEAARDMELKIGLPPSRENEDLTKSMGVEIIQSGWERSNYYVEMRRWKT